MLFTTAATSLVALFATATFSSALPTAADTDALFVRQAGPSGSVISPAGDTAYHTLDAIHLQYQRVLQGDYATTSSIAVRLITFDGKVTYHNNNITVRPLFECDSSCRGER
jgi:hypothetical protein